MVFLSYSYVPLIAAIRVYYLLFQYRKLITYHHRLSLHLEQVFTYHTHDWNATMYYYSVVLAVTFVFVYTYVMIWLYYILCILGYTMYILYIRSIAQNVCGTKFLAKGFRMFYFTMIFSRQKISENFIP